MIRWIVRGSIWLCMGLFVFSQGCSCSSPGGLALVATDLPNDTLQWSETEVGKVGKASFTLFNDSLVPLQIEKMEIESSTPGVFSLSNPPVYPLVLQSGKSSGYNVELVYNPPDDKLHTAKLYITAENADNVDALGRYVVQIKGNNTTFLVNWSCGKELNFGGVVPGESKILTCELTNPGTRSVKISAVKYQSSGGSGDVFKWILPKMPVELAAKGELFVRVSYNPKAKINSEEDKGTFVLESNARNETESKALQLSVRGRPSAVAQYDFKFNYGNCSTDSDCSQIDTDLVCSSELGKTCQPNPSKQAFQLFETINPGSSVEKTFLLRSTGQSPLKVDSFSLSGSIKEYQVLSPTSFPFTLSSGEEKPIKVRYTPIAGENHRAELKVLSNAQGQDNKTVLLQPKLDVCLLTVSPKNLEFKNLNESRTLILTNDGSKGCVITSVKLSSNSSSAFVIAKSPVVPITLSPNQFTSIQVLFKPTNQTKFAGEINIFTNESSAPKVRIPLSAPDVADQECNLQVDNQVLDYGFVTVGDTATKSLTLKNLGKKTCFITGVRLSSGSSGFAINKGISIKSLAAGASHTFEISFAPTSRNKVIDRLEVTSPDNATTTTVVQLQGTGTLRCLHIKPSTLDFGTSNVSCRSKIRDITVLHTGTQGCPDPITISQVVGTTPSGQKAPITILLPPDGLTLKPGDSRIIQVAFKPTQIGVTRFQLELTTNLNPGSKIILPMEGEGVQASTHQDVYKQITQIKSDILFVIDNSCSMGDDQARLYSNTRYYLNWAVRLNVDYQIMVITMDDTGNSYPAGCAMGTTKVIKKTTPNPNTTLAANLNVGTSGSGKEVGLFTAYQALSPQRLNDPKCNKGFLRKDADLSIVFLSDELEASSYPAAFYTRFFRSLKSSSPTKRVTASVVGGPPPIGCKTQVATAPAMTKYWQVSQDLNGIQGSICDPKWTQTLDKIVANSWKYPTTFPVTREPKSNSIKVRVNGVIIPENATNGWQFNKNLSLIKFSINQIPKPGATVSISYEPICTP